MRHSGSAAESASGNLEESSVQKNHADGKEAPSSIIEGIVPAAIPCELSSIVILKSTGLGFTYQKQMSLGLNVSFKKPSTEFYRNLKKPKLSGFVCKRRIFTLFSNFLHCENNARSPLRSVKSFPTEKCV